METVDIIKLPIIHGLPRKGRKFTSTVQQESNSSGVPVSNGRKVTTNYEYADDNQTVTNTARITEFYKGSEKHVVVEYQQGRRWKLGYSG
jgi:hypothetical protein